MGDVNKKHRQRTIDCFNFLPSNHRCSYKYIETSIVNIDGENKRENLKIFSFNCEKKHKRENFIFLIIIIKTKDQIYKFIINQIKLN